MPAEDTFATFLTGLMTSAVGAEVVVPHNTNEQTFVCRALYVGVEGDVTVLMMDNSVVLFKSLAVGIHPIRAKRVNATGTTATDMLFLK